MKKIKYEDGQLINITSSFLEENLIKYKINVAEEIVKASLWLKTAGRKGINADKYKNFELFLNNWFRRKAQNLSQYNKEDMKSEDFFS